MSLAQCIIHGEQQLVEDFIQQGVNLNEYDEYGFTPLIEAAIANNNHIGKLLLENGADPNFQDLTHGTALHWAVENNNTTLCELLFKHNANPNLYNLSSEPPLVKAILRKQHDLVKLLRKHGASIDFANDYIHTKLLGHRYELVGHVDIADSHNQFTEVNFEGFIFEFTLGIINISLTEYLNHFVAKNLQQHFDNFRTIITALDNAQELLHYQQYQTDYHHFENKINAILNQELLIIPVSYEGHATTWIRYKNILAICDRRKNDDFLNGISFYKLNPKNNLHSGIIKTLLFTKNTQQWIEHDLPKKLRLQLISRLMIEPQMAGNCSWANTEACIPACLFLLADTPFDQPHGIIDFGHPCLDLYRQWREWDKTRSLHFTLDTAQSKNESRNASKAALLGAILFQRLQANRIDNLELAADILKLLMQDKYRYIIESYKTIYSLNKPTQAGDNMRKLIDMADWNMSL